MSQFIDSSVAPSLKEQFSLTRAKKAYSAGVGGAVVGAGTISLSGIFADGKIDGPEIVGAIGAVVGGFVVGFITAWLPKQPSSTASADVLVPGDGLGDTGEPKHSA